MNVSLVVPTLNSGATLQMCLSSLKPQLAKGDEIIVIDSFSKDNTVKIAENFGAEVIETKGKRSAARNIGWKKAKNDVIIFIESDSIYEKNYITIIKTRMKDKKVNCILDRRALFKPKTWVAKTLQKEFEIRQSNNYNNNPPNPWILRIDSLKKVGGFDEKLEYGEDADLGIRLKKSGYKIVFEKNAIQYHLDEPKTLGEVAKRAWKFGRNMKKFYIKNRGLPKTKIAAFLCSIFFPPFLILIFFVDILKYNSLSLQYRIMLSFLSILRNLVFSLSYAANWLATARI